MGKREKTICCFCGVREGTTRDHVPPKAIFTSPLPNNLITVPACAVCNNDASKNDELFKVYLGMHIATKGGYAKNMFERILPSLLHNNSLKNKMLSELSPRYLSDKDGVSDKMYAMLWDSDAHDSTIERITRGLFYNQYKEILNPQAKIETYWFNKPPDYPLDNLYCETIQDGAFTFFYNRAEDANSESIWFYQFHNAHWSGASTSLYIVSPC